MRRTLLILAVLLMGIASCKKDNTNPTKIDLGYDYYPTKTGSFITYAVDSIYHDQPDPNTPGTHDTLHYQIKQKIAGSFVDNEGRFAYKIERYKRQDTTEAWQLQEVWYTVKTTGRVELMEGNTRFVKLGFPVDANVQWDLNAFNTNTPWICHYASIDSSIVLNGQSFDSTVTVIQRSEVNAVRIEQSSEQYARGIGMISKKYRVLDTQVNYQNNPTTSNIRDGNELYYTIINHGME